MTRDDIKALLKVTKRAIKIILIWKSAVIALKQHKKNQYLLRSANDFIAELAEYERNLRELLKGEESQDLPEQLRWLLDELKKAKDKNVQKIYTKKILELTKRYLTEDDLEVKDGPQGTIDQGD